MKVAVLGAAGLLGRYVCRQLERDGCTVVPITRQQLDLSLYSSVKTLLKLHLDWVVNCAGIVKCRQGESQCHTALLNSALPHWLEYESMRYRTRLLHVSSDCVFSGAEGRRSEDDSPDPADLYGASKLAGEVRGPDSLTIRTSFIGLEQGTERGLLAWLLRQTREKRVVTGYSNVLWSGLSAAEVARVISRVLHTVGYPPTGLYHVAGGTISKLDLLLLLRAAFDLDVEIVPSSQPSSDMTLNSTRFRVATGYSPPTWNIMAQELAGEWRATQ